VASFAALASLWPDPRLERAPWHPVGRIAGRLTPVCGAIGVGLLALTLWAGFAGAQDAFANWAPTFVLVIFWVGLAFASVLLGDVFRAFNPWLAVGRVVFREPRRPYPAWLGMWPAALGLLGFTWLELASGVADQPDKIALAAVVYSLVTWACMAVFGAEVWSRNGEAFGVYFGLFGRLSVFEVRDGRLGRRMFLSGLTRLQPLAGTVAVVCVMIGSVTFDGFSQGQLWKRDLAPRLFDVFGSTVAASTVGLLLGVAVVAGFYTLAVPGSPRTFIHSLVPIALVYALAHYLTFLVFQGQSIAFLASDPLGRGWDLFGTASAAINYSVLGQDATWYLQVVFVICGHIAGLVLAHDRALVVYGHARQAVRSQYWMLGVMVGFTSLALWLLSQANR
jgi:hypothetical protein